MVATTSFPTHTKEELINMQKERISEVPGEKHETYLCGESLMYRIVQDPKPGELKQLLLPAALKEKAITSLHDDMGHQGLERSLQLVRERC